MMLLISCQLSEARLVMNQSLVNGFKYSFMIEIKIFFVMLKLISS